MAVRSLGAPAPKITKLFRSKWAKAGLALIILNEIRGLIVVGSILWARYA